MIRLEELLKINALDMRLIACANSEDTWIRWVHTVEDLRDVERLKGGELVVSSGRWCNDRSAADSFVCGLTQRGVAALGIGVSEQIALEGVVEACERWRLPLIEIRHPTTCERVSETAASLIVDRRTAILSESVQRERVFAAVAGSGVRETLDLLQRDLHHSVCLVTRGAVHTSSRDPLLSSDDLRLLGMSCGRSIPVLEVPLATSGAVTTFAVERSFSKDRRNVARLVCGCPRDALDSHTIALFEQAALFLGLQLQHGDEVRALRRRGESELIRRILADEASPEETAAWVEALHIESLGAVTCVVIKADELDELQLADFADALDDLADTTSSSRVFSQGESEVGIALMRSPDEIAGPLEHCRTLIEDQLNRSNAYLGSSSAVATSIGDVARLFSQARQVLRLESLRHSTGRGPAVGADIPLAALMLQTDMDARRRLTSILLDPLIEYDASHDSDLMNTLYEYLSANGHWNVAAASLGLHVNTLRYRVARIEEVTKRDLSTMRDRADFFIALRCRIEL